MNLAAIFPRWKQGDRQMIRMRESVFYRAVGLSVAFSTLGFAYRVRADPPATRPAGENVSTSAPNVRKGSVRRLGMPVGPERRNEMISADEIRSATEFFEANSPNRMEFFKRLPPESNLRAMLANDLVWRYRPIKVYKESSPELYESLVQLVKLRDEAFELARDGDSAALHAKASAIVDQTLIAQKMRLDILEQELHHQREQYVTAAADPSHLVDAEQKRLVEDEERLMRRVEPLKNAHGELKPDAIGIDPLADTLPSESPTDSTP